jgi:hypothetical protein
VSAAVFEGGEARKEKEGQNMEPLQWLKTICFDIIYGLTRVLMMLEDSPCK